MDVAKMTRRQIINSIIVVATVQACCAHSLAFGQGLSAISDTPVTIPLGLPSTFKVNAVAGVALAGERFGKPFAYLGRNVSLNDDNGRFNDICIDHDRNILVGELVTRSDNRHHVYPLVFVDAKTGASEAHLNPSGVLSADLTSCFQGQDGKEYAIGRAFRGDRQHDTHSIIVMEIDIKTGNAIVTRSFDVKNVSANYFPVAYSWRRGRIVIISTADDATNISIVGSNVFNQMGDLELNAQKTFPEKLMLVQGKTPQDPDKLQLFTVSTNLPDTGQARHFPIYALSTNPISIKKKGEIASSVIYEIDSIMRDGGGYIVVGQGHDAPWMPSVIVAIRVNSHFSPIGEPLRVAPQAGYTVMQAKTFFEDNQLSVWSNQYPAGIGTSLSKSGVLDVRALRTSGPPS